MQIRLCKVSAVPHQASLDQERTVALASWRAYVSDNKTTKIWAAKDCMPLTSPNGPAVLSSPLIQPHDPHPAHSNETCIDTCSWLLTPNFPVLPSAGVVAWWPPANTTFGPPWTFPHLQTWTDTTTLCLTNQRMILIHHWLAPPRLGTTTHPKLRLSHSCPLSSPAAITAVHTELGTSGTRAVWLAHGQQPRGTDKPGCTSPFPHCSVSS